jgi:hypothetical protein
MWACLSFTETRADAELIAPQPDIAC